MSFLYVTTVCACASDINKRPYSPRAQNITSYFGSINSEPLCRRIKDEKRAIISILFTIYASPKRASLKCVCSEPFFFCFFFFARPVHRTHHDDKPKNRRKKRTQSKDGTKEQQQNKSARCFCHACIVSKHKWRDYALHAHAGISVSHIYRSLIPHFCSCVSFNLRTSHGHIDAHCPIAQCARTHTQSETQTETYGAHASYIRIQQQSAV